MEGYLGEFPVTNLAGTPFEGFTKNQWTLWYLEQYGQSEGEHHKALVIDLEALLNNFRLSRRYFYQLNPTL